MDSVDVIDIHGEFVLSEKGLRNQILDGLAGDKVIHSVREKGLPTIKWKKSLPTVVLYDERGIDLFEDITREPAYYIYREELAILEKYRWEIAALLNSPTNPYIDSALTGLPKRGEENNQADLHLTIVDLGAGRLDKAECLLRSIETKTRRLQDLGRREKISTTYYAVDIQYQGLRARLLDLLRGNPAFLNGHYEDWGSQVVIRGICGSYLDTLNLLQDGGLMHKTPPLNDKLVKITHRKCILWLGSSLSNMPLLEVITLLSKFVTGALKAGDTFLIGVDHCRDMDKVKAAYSESSDCWKAYVRNGVKNAGKVLGGDAATKLNGGLNWEYVTRWDAVNNRHMRFVRSKTQISFDILLSPDCNNAISVDMEEGEYILIAQSYKHSLTEVEHCFRQSGLDIISRWTRGQADCSLYLLGRPCTSSEGT